MAGFGDEVLILSAPHGTTNLGTQGVVADATYEGGMGTVADTAFNGRRAFSFDGTNDVLRGNLLAGVSFPRTIAGWFRISRHSLASRLLAVAGGTVATSIAQSSLSGGIWVAGETTSQQIRQFGIGSWGHIVGVFTTEASVAIWVNGAISTIIGGSSSLAQGALPNDAYAVGARWGDQFCSMLADDIRVLPRALTNTEITNWYAAGRGYGLPVKTSTKKRILTSYMSLQ